MEKFNASNGANSPFTALDTEVSEFAESLPDWTKYMCAILLSGHQLQEEDISVAYQYLLEDSLLKTKTTRPLIKISGSDAKTNFFKKDLLLTKLEKVEGVNALAESQTIEFAPTLTILYGSNGSGKSGYVRLLNNAFVSKGDKNILPNIYLDTTQKTAKAEFEFASAGIKYTLKFPDSDVKMEFRQYSVFDSKSIPVYLNNRNQFEFRPAGLNFFGLLIDGFRKIEEKLLADVKTMSEPKDYSALFDGDSVVKTFLASLSEKTKIEDIKRYLPFTEEDNKKRAGLEEKKAVLQALKKDKEIADLIEKKNLVENLKKSIESNNKPFTGDHLSKIQSAISDCLSKQELAKKEGIEVFKTEALKGIGGLEWKIFIESAQKFAIVQVENAYPNEGDVCLLCHQPLSVEARNLIKSYWAFIKSAIEKEAKDAQLKLENAVEFFSKMKFDLLPRESILAKWIEETFPDRLVELRGQLESQKILCENLIEDLSKKTAINRSPVLISSDALDEIILNIDNRIKLLLFCQIRKNSRFRTRRLSGGCLARM